MDNILKFNQLRYSSNFTPEVSDVSRIEIYKRLVGTNKRILDVGCGDGYIGSLLKAQGNFVAGLEGSIDAANVASTKLDGVLKVDLNTNWSSQVFDKYDVVFCGEVLEHIFDTDVFLENIKKVLSDNGLLIISTPNIASLGRRIMLLLGVSPNVEITSRLKDSGHIRYFTLKTLRNLLEEHEFDVQSITSNIVNFTKSGRVSSMFLGKVFPSLGTTLIASASLKNR